MEERQVRELLDRLITSMDPAEEYQARHEDFSVEFPQSGERMNRDNLRAMQEAYPGGDRQSFACAGWSVRATCGSPRPWAATAAEQ